MFVWESICGKALLCYNNFERKISDYMKQTIYQYVINHLDENGIYTENTLCDDRFSTIFKPLGTEDAFYYTMNMQSNSRTASMLAKELREYIANPCQQSSTKLYKALKGVAFAEYCDPFVETFGTEDMNLTAYELARRFFYNAQNREQVKFAVLLFGLHGMEKIKAAEPQLWEDLLKLAHCEEFTFAFLYACRLTNFTPQQEVWQLICCTCGWGKVFAVIDCKCCTDEERLWLLENGIEINVEYPPLSVKFIKEIRLVQLLQQPLPYNLYKSAVVIIGNYLIFLNHFPIEMIEESFNIQDIDLYSMLCSLLQQAQKQAEKPEDILDMLSLATALRQLAEEQNLSQLTFNQCQLLIAECEKIAYAKDWKADILANLIKDGSINYQICDLAYEMDLDIWPLLYEYWLAHPKEINLLPYLLSYDGGGRSQIVLQQFENNLPLYTAEPDALLVPLRYLNTHPGMGENIICAALESIYDLPRGIACGILDDWGREFMTSVVKQSLIKARSLSNNDVVTARIDCLLQGRKFDISKFLK